MRANRILSTLFSLSLVLVMSACGGGGRKSDNAISVSPTSLTFTVVRNQTAPAEQNFNFTYKGDGFMVGIPTGGSLPAWADPHLVSYTSTTGIFGVGIKDTTLAAGTYTMVLRFVAGDSDGSNLVQQDVTVTYVVTLPTASEGSVAAMTAPAEASALADVQAKVPVVHNMVFVPGVVQPAN